MLLRLWKNRYRRQVSEIKSQIDDDQAINPGFHEDGCRILELSRSLHSLYATTNYEEKADVLRFAASNFMLSNETLYPICRKPFDILAKGSSVRKNSPWRTRFELF